MIKYNINITPPPPHYIGIKLYRTAKTYLYTNWLIEAEAFLLFTPLIFPIDAIFSKFFNFNKLLRKFNLSALKFRQTKRRDDFMFPATLRNYVM